MGSTIAGCDRLFHQVKGLTETPHVRGEDLAPEELTLSVGETPPRTWGRLKELGQSVERLGNTPTYVGKTDLAGRKLVGVAESHGNTPTYVGKTNKQVGQNPENKKHPHVRGEDLPIAPSP